jgi:Ni,Fe-hydrogenase maturation factor
MSDEAKQEDGSVIKRPGHINVNMAFTGAAASGCGVIEFVDLPERWDEAVLVRAKSAGTQFMEWAAEHKGMLVVDIRYASDASNHGRILVLYTNTLTEEQLQEIRETEEITQSVLREHRMKKAAAKAEQAKAVQHAVDETQRLAELGRVHEANCQKAAKKGKR